ncbi:MAG TPA: pyridoxamine 5'-phosphate oxidase family protein [Paracoccaceae bacterium]|nr:pyridoxamine 5'-phosphate oxidase family protein [Paracoccaceae bacterium]
MARSYYEIAFTDAVRDRQIAAGSAASYAKLLAPEAEPRDRFTAAEAEFVAARDGFYMATVSATGWPYLQFRGGPRGFLKLLDARTLGFADLRGNRQYVSAGNLDGNPRVALFLMDYANRRRLKILGRARIVEAAEAPDLVQGLSAPGTEGRAERAVLIALAGFDWNCSQHIPQRFTADEITDLAARLQAEIAALRAENARLREALER